MPEEGNRGGTTRDRLLEAAERILIEQGVHALTVRRVGAVSALNATLITYHFQSISGLLAELCRLNLDPMVAEWRDLEEAPGFEPLLETWLRPLVRPAAFTPKGRALIVLDEIAAHGDPQLSAPLLQAMAGIGGRVHAALQPHLPGLPAHELAARLRFIAGAALGPPPRNRMLDPRDGRAPLDSLTHLLAFATAALRG